MTILATHCNGGLSPYPVNTSRKLIKAIKGHGPTVHYRNELDASLRVRVRINIDHMIAQGGGQETEGGAGTAMSHHMIVRVPPTSAVL